MNKSQRKPFNNKTILVICLLIASLQPCSANTSKQLKLLKKAYPDFIKNISSDTLIWTDGSQTNIKNNSSDLSDESPSLLEQLNQPTYPTNKLVKCETYIPKNDPGRIRNESFFAKMYGHTENEVKNNLDTIYWMPIYFGEKYPLLVTKINGVNVKLKQVSHQLELLVKKHPDFIKYLDKPDEVFYWRNIENSNRRSPHSFGIAIDLNLNYTNYWVWDTGIKENKINQSDHIPYKNRIPCEIVTVFERNGFIWGGKWLHYDTMHFEYRPELLLP